MAAMQRTANATSNPVALVTGGAAGVGRALCEQLAAERVTVVIADIADSQAVAGSIREKGGQAESVLLDVSREAEVQRVVDQVAAVHGRLDYMFNNAAVAAVGELRDGNVADFRRVMDVNLF